MKKMATKWTDEQIVAAAKADPDAQPMTEEQMARKPVARSKVIRRVLRLTQEEFCERYGIALGTLRDWEQGKTEPDQTARAYLRTIATDPDGVARNLARSRESLPASLPAGHSAAPTPPRARMTKAAARTAV